MSMPTSSLLAVSWICRLVAAAILLQTLYFKFTGAEESVFIFSRLGVEPWGRYGTGVAELAAAVLLVVPRHAWAGAALAAVLMTGAIFSHVTVLGVAIRGDRGLLFGLAVVVLACALAVLAIHRDQIPFISKYLTPA